MIQMYIFLEGDNDIFPGHLEPSIIFSACEKAVPELCLDDHSEFPDREPSHFEHGI